jgi:hypothetical protein
MENKTYIILPSFKGVNETIDISGAEIVNQQGTDASGYFVSITNVSNTLKETTVRLKNITSSLQSKLNNHMKC